MTSVPAPSRLAEVSDWMKSNGLTQLRLYHGKEPINDLEFLQHFPFLTGFWVDLELSLRSTAGLRYLGPSLSRLGLGSFHRPHATDFVSQLPALKTLWITGRLDKPERLCELAHLEDLWLNGTAVTSLPDMGVLESVSALHLHGGSLPDLGPLHSLPNMQHLEIWSIRGLSTFDALGSLPALQVLRLDSLSRFERFPNLSGSTSLRRLHTGTQGTLIDVSALTSAAALEELVLGLCPRLDPSELAVLRRCPRLRRVAVGLNSAKRNEAAAAILAKFDKPEYTPSGATWDEW
jgi:Leucine-rich repeat (LRR) protein